MEKERGRNTGYIQRIVYACALMKLSRFYSLCCVNWVKFRSSTCNNSIIKALLILHLFLFFTEDHILFPFQLLFRHSWYFYIFNMTKHFTALYMNWAWPGHDLWAWVCTRLANYLCNTKAPSTGHLTHRIKVSSGLNGLSYYPKLLQTVVFKVQYSSLIVTFSIFI